MKAKDQKSTSEGIYCERVDELIDKKFPKLLERAQMDGSHQGMDNNPAVDTLSIEPNISVYKAACEAIIAEIMQFIMPASSREEAKIEADHYNEKDKVLDEEIKQKEEEKRQVKYKLGNSDVHGIAIKLIVVGVATLILSTGDMFYNTMSFLMTGDNTFFALVLAGVFSFAVFLFSHVIAKCTKEIEKLKKDKEELKKMLYEKAQGRIRNIDYARRTLHRVNKLYHEIVSHYINANINARKDGKIPKVFIRKIPNLDINQYKSIIHSPINTKSK